MAKRSTTTKKEISLFDTTTPDTTTTTTTTTTTPEPTTPEPTTPEPTDQGLEMFALKCLLTSTDEKVIADTAAYAEKATQSLIAYCKENLQNAVEILSASMAQKSLMTQAQAQASIMVLLEGKTGYDKLETQVYICRYSTLLCRINELIHGGMKAFLAIAVACYEQEVVRIPACIRTLFNACIVYQKKDTTGLMQWVFWTPKDRTRNAIATHAIAQGCFIRATGLEYLFTPDMPQLSIETKCAVSVTGEPIVKPVIEYQWAEKSQRVLAFWRHIGADKSTWEKSLAQYDSEAKSHIVDYETRENEKLAKANTSTSLKGLESTKKAPNAVKVRNAKLMKLFADMDF